MLLGSTSTGDRTLPKDSLRKDSIKTAISKKTLKEAQEAALKEGTKSGDTEKPKHYCHKCGRG